MFLSDRVMFLNYENILVTVFIVTGFCFLGTVLCFQVTGLYFSVTGLCLVSRLCLMKKGFFLRVCMGYVV